MNTRITLIAVLVVAVIGATSYFVFSPSSDTTPAPTATSTVPTTTPNTPTPVSTTTATVAISTPKSPAVITKIVKTTTVVTHTVPPVVPPPTPIQPATTTPVVIAGTGTLTVSPIPLLSGGNAKPGSLVPVSYLQISNTGTTTVQLNGFKLKENGSASDVSIIGLQTVDEKGGSRGYVGGSESTTPFVNGIAEAATYAILAPGQMKLFTVKVQLSANAGQYAGTQIIISVTGLNATATARGNFPIAGTTWTITP